MTVGLNKKGIFEEVKIEEVKTDMGTFRFPETNRNLFTKLMDFVNFSDADGNPDCLLLDEIHEIGKKTRRV